MNTGFWLKFKGLASRNVKNPLLQGALSVGADFLHSAIACRRKKSLMEGICCSVLPVILLGKVKFFIAIQQLLVCYKTIKTQTRAVQAKEIFFSGDNVKTVS